MFCSACGQSVGDGNKFCDHCGAAVLEETSLLAKSSGIDCVSLSVQLKELANSIESLENVIAEAETVKLQLQTSEPRKPRTATKWWGMKYYIILAIFLFVLGFSFAGTGDSFFVGFGVVFLVGAVALTVVGIVLGGRRSERFNENEMNRYVTETQNRKELLVNSENRLKELDRTKSVLVEKIQELMIFNGSEIKIPKDYFYAEAIRFFADRIDTGRSKSIAEAMDAFDEYAHRLKLEQSAEQSAKNLAAVRRSNAINAAVNIVDTVHHW